MDRFHFACLYLRYQRRELSWATFLDLAGRFADQADSEIPCEFFFEMLNALEDAEFSSALEESQKKLVLNELGDAVEEVTTAIGPLL